MEESPYLTAIQSLKGRTASQKYQELHATVKQLIEPSKVNGIAAAVGSSSIPYALRPLIRILIGNALKSYREVMEALKSEDTTIQNQALRATWFFDGSHKMLNAEFFMKNVMPYVSIHMRGKIIKMLSINLRGKYDIADEFFTTFAKEYGYARIESLLYTCGEEMIDKVLFDLHCPLSRRQIREIFRERPTFIVNRLREAYYEENSRFHYFRWEGYKSFLPSLVKDYPSDFIELCKYINDVKIGHDLQKHLLKACPYQLIKNPEIFVSLISLEIIVKELTSTEFEDFIENLFLMTSSSIFVMLDYLKYYPKDKRLALLERLYRLKHRRDLLDDPEILTSNSLMELLPLEKKQQIVKSMINAGPRNSAYYLECCYYLPANDAFRILKKELSDTNDKDVILGIFKKMIRCCIVNVARDSFLSFLHTFKERQNIDCLEMSYEILAYIGSEVPYDFLKRMHWIDLRQIMTTAYSKKLALIPQLNCILEKALNYLIAESERPICKKDNEGFLDELVQIILEFCITHAFDTIIYVRTSPEITKKCFDIFFQALPQKYPDKAWRPVFKKNVYVHRVLETISRINKRYSETSGENKPKKLSVLDFPWLKETIKSILLSSENNSEGSGACCFTYVDEIKILLARMEPSFCDLIVDSVSSNETNEFLFETRIETGVALKLLKIEPDRVQNNWIQYFKACQKLIEFHQSATLAVRRFIRASRWHEILPLNFIEYCLIDVTNPANIVILGLLSEGEVLSRILSKYNEHFHEMRTQSLLACIPEAVSVANPPVTCQFLEEFCYGLFKERMLLSIVRVCQKITLPRAKKFAKQLISKTYLIKHCAFYLYLRMVNEKEQQDFLRDSLKLLRGDDDGFSNLVITKIRNDFVAVPSKPTWQLMKECIRLLPAEKHQFLRDFGLIKWRFAHSFSGKFFIEIFLKIEQLEESEKNFSKYRYLTSISETLAKRDNLKGLPDKECQDILNRHLFKIDFYCGLDDTFDENILEFAVKNYLWESPNRFQARWNYVSKFLAQPLKNWNKQDPDKTPPFYRANRAMRIFFDCLFAGMVKKYATAEWLKTPEPLKTIQKTLVIVLKPQQETLSCLKVSFCVKYTECQSWKEFGTLSGNYIKRLVESFRSDIIIEEASVALLFAISVFSPFDKTRYDDITEVMGGLIKAENHYAKIMCVEMLCLIDYRDNADKFVTIIDRLRECDNVTVKYKLSRVVASY